MKFRSIEQYKVTKILKPKSVYVQELELIEGDVLEFTVELPTRYSAAYTTHYSINVTVRNTGNNREKTFSQANLNVFFNNNRRVVDLKEVRPSFKASALHP